MWGSVFAGYLAGSFVKRVMKDNVIFKSQYELDMYTWNLGLVINSAEYNMILRIFQVILPIKVDLV